MNIHEVALTTFGLKGRLAKLRTEATELANAIDRWEEGKGTLDEILHEILDVDFVENSIMMSDDFPMSCSYLKNHEKESFEKLTKAIKDVREKRLPKIQG